jgi:class 3 adenylate cyclase
MSMQPETQFAVGPEGQVGYQVFGEGPVDVLLVLSISNIEVMWEEPRVERFLRRLASFSRVIIFDKRGTGVSDPVPLGALPTLEEWTEDIRVILDAVGCDRAAVVGAGMGSLLAIVFAASHPERAAALILLDGLSCGMRKEDYPPGLPPDLVDRAIEWAKQRDWAPLLAPSLAEDEEFRRWMRRLGRLAVSPTAAERIFRYGLVSCDVRAALPTITAPTLVLHRSGNRFVPVDHGRYLGEHIKGATYVEFPGADSEFYVGNQDAILDEIQGFLTGVRGEPDINRVLATVIFTDLVSSTERAAELGDRRWREVLDSHDGIARRHIKHFRGRLIKATGDGVLATFDGPARAIRCTRIIEDEVRKLGVEVRAGLHTGEVELRGDDIGGIAVALAARVMGEAAPSEVLVSSTVKDLVVGSGIEFEDRGTHQLKGVPGEWRLFAVTSA